MVSYTTYLLQPIVLSPTTPPTSSRLLSPYRPLSYIPSALLLTCRQIHTEVCLLSFHDKEFVFISWFASSVLPAARAFVKSQRP